MYKLSKYNIIREFDESVIIYNLSRNTCILIDKVEYSNVLIGYATKEEDKLIEAGILVDESINELKEQFALKAKNKRCEQYTYTILPTLRCNARCKYCYENYWNSKTRMDRATLDAVNAYIKSNTPIGSCVCLILFGGEPLLEVNAIDEIIATIAQVSLGNYSTTIFTNGSKIESYLAKKMRSDWKLQTAQITLDGIYNDYNLRKNYIYDGVEYEEVLKNIRLLEETGVNVRIRVNIDHDNFPQIEEILRKLKQEFYGKRVQIYFSPLFDYTGTEKMPNYFKECELEYFYKQVLQIEDSIYSDAQQLKRPPVSIACYSEMENSVVIAPNGDLYKCHHLDEDACIGDIGSVKKIEVFNKSIDAECCECLFLPVCQGGCPYMQWRTGGKIKRCRPIKYDIDLRMELMYKHLINDLK
jgi:uncharacterized protein